MKSFIPYIALIFVCSGLAVQNYSKLSDITGPAFYDEFTFFTAPDPTHGRVSYVDQQTAQQYNLTYATDDTFILRADYTTYLTPSDPGRMSARLVSREKYHTSVMVFDTRHMPEGCGTWPAIWTLGDDWPNQGEIDILEGVNDMGPNLASLHTGSNCRMSSSREMSGRPTGTNCAAGETENTGCGVAFSDLKSFGPLFNDNDGGWYALERTEETIKIWFWPRDDDSVPGQIKFGSSHDIVEPNQWGLPAAVFSSETCDFAEHFGAHNIVINLTFCGDWAGVGYAQSYCPDTCEHHVDTNPGSFRNAYFEFLAIRIYT